MYLVSEPAPGVVLPPIVGLLTSRPVSWQGMELKWAQEGHPVPVFLKDLVLDEVTADGRAFVFGARYNLAHVLVGGQNLGRGHFVEYVVVVRARDGTDWQVHRLLQRKSVTYSATDDRDDTRRAREVSKPAQLSIRNPPRWKVSEAEWPTHSGELMKFVGQFTVPENRVSRVFFTWNVTAYVFWSGKNQQDCFKIVEQRPHEQTAEEFYASTDE